MKDLVIKMLQLREFICKVLILQQIMNLGNVRQANTESGNFSLCVVLEDRVSGQACLPASLRLFNHAVGIYLANFSGNSCGLGNRRLEMRLTASIVAPLRPVALSFDVISMISLETWGLSKHRRSIQDQKDFPNHGLVKSQAQV